MVTRGVTLYLLGFRFRSSPTRAHPSHPSARSTSPMAEILYADDDDLFRQMVGSVLEAEGHNVRIVTDGSKAIREIHRSLPDLILLDYRMGDPDGFAVCRQIKDDPRFGHVPILILTAEAHIDSRLQGFDAGADDYLAKPFDSRELAARTTALLKLARRGLDRNPSSGLPGGEAIRREFESRRAEGRPFAICYLDLDNFKPFGERFGFAVSDGVIGDVGDLLASQAQSTGAFAGHVGGDDFILICEPADARQHVEALQTALAMRVRTRVPAENASTGHYTGKDRSGAVKVYPLTSISAALLQIPAAYDTTLVALGEIVSPLKDKAKQQGGSGLVEVHLPLAATTSGETA